LGTAYGVEKPWTWLEQLIPQPPVTLPEQSSGFRKLITIDQTVPIRAEYDL
jgi:hypothetical protein